MLSSLFFRERSRRLLFLPSMWYLHFRVGILFNHRSAIIWRFRSFLLARSLGLGRCRYYSTPHSVNNHHLNFFCFFHSPNVLGINDNIGALRSFEMRRTRWPGLRFLLPLWGPSRHHRRPRQVDRHFSHRMHDWESWCSLLSGTPLGRVYRKMRAVGCRCSHRKRTVCERTPFCFFSEDDDGAMLLQVEDGVILLPCNSLRYR